MRPRTSPLTLERPPVAARRTALGSARWLRGLDTVAVDAWGSAQ